MNKILPLFVLLTAGFLSVSNLDGAFPENTGAPNELTCGRAPCHNVPVNVGDAVMSLQFSGNGQKYMPDSTYELTVSIADQPTIRNGFEILALNANNQNTGTWILLDPAKMKIIPGIGLPNRKYVTHKAAGNMQTEWKVAWKAPSTNVGTITFYASVNASNNNGMLTGDEIYTKSLPVTFSAVSGTQETQSGDHFGLISVGPATSRHGLEIGYHLDAPAEVKLEVFNLLGQFQATVFAGKQVTGTHQVAWSGLPFLPGVYLVRLSKGNKISTLKCCLP